jgi:hypothetical protein
MTPSESHASKVLRTRADAIRGTDPSYAATLDQIRADAARVLSRDAEQASRPLIVPLSGLEDPLSPTWAKVPA